VIDGLENTPKALIGLLAGENRGKRMINGVMGSPRTAPSRGFGTTSGEMPARPPTSPPAVTLSPRVVVTATAATSRHGHPLHHGGGRRERGRSSLVK